jgi:hypothetical protein
VLIPTGLDVHDGQPKSLSDIMEAVGIPDSMQGSDGVTMPVSFTMTPGAGGAPGVMPAGATGGSTGVNWDAIAGAESGGNWSITYGEGPDVTGGLQIATAAWLSHGGGAYAPKAYMATKEQQIAVAQSILNDPAQGPTAWPTTYRNHPDWFGGGAGSGGGAGGLPGASVTYTPDWMLQHGFRPLLEKAGGAVTPGEIPASVQALAASYGLTATDHADTTLHGGIAGPGNTIDPHGSWAFDFSGNVANEQAFADAMKTYAAQIVQEIWQNPNTGQQVGIAGGQLLGPGQYYTGAEGYSAHTNHVHVAFTSVPAPARGVPTGTVPLVMPADYTGGSRIVTASGGTPGLPQSPAPTAPGSSFTDVPPPPGYQPAAPGTPDTVQTPWGDFQYSWQMSPDQQALLTPEQRQKFDQWLQKYAHRAEQTQSDQDAIDKAQADEKDALDRKTQADKDFADQQKRILPSMTQSQQDLITGSTEYQNAQKAAAAADKAYASAQQRTADARRRHADNTVSSNIEDESPPRGSPTRTRNSHPTRTPKRWVKAW